MHRSLFHLIFLALISAPIIQAASINSCKWFYSNPYERLTIINELTDQVYSKKERRSVKNRQGDIIAYDFIPGSLKKKPIVISGGLWYKIQYFEIFTKFATQQSLASDIFSGAEKMLHQAIKELVVNGNPIIITSRKTQPESIQASLSEKLQPPFIKSNDVTLDEHAQDVIDVVEHLRTSKEIGAKQKVELISLSYGVTVAVHTSALYGEKISHKHIMAPLAFSGDNFPKETAMQERVIKGIKASYSMALMNPLTRAWAEMAMNAQISLVYSNSASKYSSNLVDGAFKNEPGLAQLEKDFPGIQRIIQKGLQADMDAARPDRYRLDDPNFIDEFKRTTIYLAGDEDPSRLKSQFEAFIKIRDTLGSEAPNLVIMDDAVHAITATAPMQTARMMTKIMSNPDLQNSNGSVFYMHRMDPLAQVIKLQQKDFDIIKNEVEAQSIGPGLPSLLEALYFTTIFNSRIIFQAQALKDLLAGLEGPIPQPPDFKENPDRPYEKLKYMTINDELKKQVTLLIGTTKETLETLMRIQKDAAEIMTKMIKDKQG